MSTVDPTIEPLREGDLSEVLQLEAENPSPWSRALWVDELRQPGGWQWQARDRGTGDLLGFLCGRTVGSEAELFKLAVAASGRRRGIATALLAHACRMLRNGGVAVLYLELRCSNEAAMALYTRMGFSISGVRKGYYTDPGEDALVMMKRL
ncbi:MAG: ribosomal protein S18-alanine N-acetyltransferase [Desulfobacteraceae bacterium]|nr:ribosomal protein S18-alanine N-acetyltransferase [Desulfobacteraceae bacterium]